LEEKYRNAGKRDRQAPIDQAAERPRKPRERPIKNAHPTQHASPVCAGAVRARKMKRVSRFACLVLIAGCSFTVTASGAASSLTRAYACSTDQLAFALPQPSAPTQTWAVGFAVYNTGRTTCRLALPLSLTLRHRSQAPLRTEPRASRLTLVAGRLRPWAEAGVTWTYENYCGRHNAGERPIVYSVRVRGIELRGRGGTPPCHDRSRPVTVRVLFACPGARGPAIDAILPRPLPLCPH
jgi:hypothetical protein